MEKTSNKKNNNIEAYKSRMQTIFYNLDIKNNICADCGKKSMDYASINNGIMICAECAKEHLSLGYNISFIHSLGEKWDDYLFNYIKVGGNTRFLQFCKDYKLDKENNKDKMKKYKSKGLTYYRDILRSEVLGYDPPENINVNKAYEEEKEIPDNYPEFKKYTFVKHVDMNYLEKKFYKKKEENEDEGIFGKIGGFFGNVKKNIEDLQIVKKVQEIDLNEVKQKGVDMFGYFFFGGNDNQKKEDENKEENKEQKDNNIIKEINNDKKEEDFKDNKEINNKNELNNIFGKEIKENQENQENNNNNKDIDIKENNEESKNIIEKEKNENEGKIEIKEDIHILTEETNNNIINDNIKVIDDNIEKNEDKKEEKENEKINDKAIEDILKDNNFNDGNTKMNNEEKDELEKMLQE